MFPPLLPPYLHRTAPPPLNSLFRVMSSSVATYNATRPPLPPPPPPRLPSAWPHGCQMIHVNLSAIITELLRALGDRKWRERQSACAGLSDVLRGRGWDDIRPHLEELWIMTDR